MLLYDTLRSGNAWKVRLLASLLNVPLERRTHSIDRGDLATPEFLAVAPLAHVPVLQLPDGTHLAESLAILHYLAQGSAWWPADAPAQSKVLSWMAFEQDRHMKPLAQLRLRRALHPGGDPQDAFCMAHEAAARAALDVLEKQLHRQGPEGWVATLDHPSIADVALYPYTCMAPMSGIDLASFPAVQDWLSRIEHLQGYQALFPGQPERNHATQEHH